MKLRLVVPHTKGGQLLALSNLARCADGEKWMARPKGPLFFKITFFCPTAIRRGRPTGRPNGAKPRAIQKESKGRGAQSICPLLSLPTWIACIQSTIFISKTLKIESQTSPSSGHLPSVLPLLLVIYCRSHPMAAQFQILMVSNRENLLNGDDGIRR